MKNGIRLSNGQSVPNLCFGSGIIWLYRYGDCSKKARLEYILNNVLHNRKQLEIDRSFSGLIHTAMKNGCHMFDTSRAYGGVSMN